MNRQEIGRFYATSFDGNVFEFIVFEDNTINCPVLNLYSIKKLNLKPRFSFWIEDNHYEYNVPSGESKLIGNYDIDDDLFAYLKDNGIISYSNDMAYLYGFNDKSGYDSEPGHYGVGSPYKWAKKKGPILMKQKQGQFN